MLAFTLPDYSGRRRRGRWRELLTSLTDVEEQMQAENPAVLASPPTASPAHGEKEEEKPMGVEAPEQRDLFARAHRRKLPDERKSITHKFSVGGHEGYIIVGMYEEGTPGELFIRMAKEGSTLSGFMDGLALSISIGLQYGVPLKAIVDKLTNTRFEPSGFTENPAIRYSSSVLDYIARWLGGKFLSSEYLKPRVAPSDQDMIGPAPSASAVSATNRIPIQSSNGGGTTGDAPSCSTCGMLMVPNGSCYKCVNCGSTSGCS
jgi:ribonucleoside-diphosphate reductase alpha chain